MSKDFSPLKPIAKFARQTADRGIFSKAHRYKQYMPGPSPGLNMAQVVNAQLLEGSDKTDRTILEDNPTTPLSESDSATQINDPLNLTGEPGADAEREALEEAERIKASQPPPTPIPDEEEIERRRRRQQARRRSSGRSSTILSDTSYGSDSLG